jgi:hypothetical protein
MHPKKEQMTTENPQASLTIPARMMAPCGRWAIVPKDTTSASTDPQRRLLIVTGYTLKSNTEAASLEAFRIRPFPGKNFT